MRKLLASKKGLQFESWMSVALGIGGGIIFIAVLALILATMSTASTDGNFTAIIGNGQTFLLNITEQLGTVGTVAGVLLLVGLLALSGIGGYALYKKSQ